MLRLPLTAPCGGFQVIFGMNMEDVNQTSHVLDVDRRRLGYRLFYSNFSLIHMMSAEPRCSQVALIYALAAGRGGKHRLSSGAWAEHRFSLECARRPLFLLGYKRNWVLGRRRGHALDLRQVRTGVGTLSAYISAAVCGSLFGSTDERCARWQLALVRRLTNAGPTQ